MQPGRRPSGYGPHDPIARPSDPRPQGDARSGRDPQPGNPDRAVISDQAVPRRARAGGGGREPIRARLPDTLGANPGEAPERLNGRDWKSRNGVDLVRGFESPPLRHLIDVRTLASKNGAGFVLGPVPVG